MRSSCLSLAALSAVLFLTGVAVAGPIPPDTFRATGGTMGEPGSFVSSTVEFDLVNDSQGWSFGLCNDGTALTLLSAVESSLVLTINGGNPPGFQSLETMPVNGDGVTMGVVIDLFGVNFLPAGLGYQILTVEYELLDVIDDMNPAPVETMVCLCNTLGDPAVDTLNVTGGNSVPPMTECGTFTIIPPPDFCLELTCVGGPDNVALSWTDCSQFDYYLLHRDGVLMETLPGTQLSFDDLGLAAGTYFYSIIGVVFPDPMGSPTILNSECMVDVIPLTIDTIDPIIGPYTGGTMVTITGLGFAPPAMDTTVELDGVTQSMITIVDDNTVTFVTQSSTVLGPVDVTVTNANGSETVVDGFTYGFIRGDANGDGFIDVADAVFDFAYLFDNGTEPECFDAADFNDDGGVNIADGIYLISFLFRSGPVPPAPFPDAGFDGTDTDPLGCLNL